MDTTSLSGKTPHHTQEDLHPTQGTVRKRANGHGYIREDGLRLPNLHHSEFFPHCKCLV